jgi:signal transduction histidine kinase/CheY-like chemotaxis protein
MVEPLPFPQRDFELTARDLRMAGAAIALGAALVLLGWVLDISVAKSLVRGWRVMVPSTALCFIFLGTALAVCSADRRGLAATASLALALAAATLAIATIHEYATGTRSGFETWGGLWRFDGAAYAGRMSPMTALVLLVLAIATGAAVVPGRRAITVARLCAGSALFVAWLAILALAVDVDRLSNEPRFPGMAAPTILFVALTGALVLGLTTLPHPGTPPGTQLRWPIWSVLTAFIAPPVLSRAHAALLQTGAIEPQLLTAAVALGFSIVLALGVWRYASRLAGAQRAQARMLTELEDRVRERTQALVASNDDLRRHEETLRTADRRKDEFLAVLAHELRNPLAPIRTAAHIVGADHATRDQQRRAGAIIERQVAVMRRLIDDLLDVSRITAGKLQIRPARVSLVEVLDLAIATTRPACDELQHELSVSLPETPIYLEADAARLAQAFGNLLHNACKFTTPRGHLMLTAVARDDGYVEVSVRDDGIGIDPAFLPRLFDKFSQAGPDVGRAQGGLGLGLSLVEGIVALHGGTVTAASAGSGHGSTFVVRLPTAAAPTPVETAVVDEPVPVSDRHTIVVVDDNQDNVGALAALLGLDGHDVHGANDGAGALALAERVRPDAMLIDLAMPGMDGFDLCRRVRAEPWGQTMLLIAQTGFGQARDVARTREVGFDWHITKPAEIAHLRQLLRQPRPPTAATAAPAEERPGPDVRLAS